jgi:fructose/tagatose bisphosphate aldolase
MLDLSEEPLEENVGTCVEYAEIVPRSCQDRAEIVF